MTQATEQSKWQVRRDTHHGHPVDSYTLHDAQGGAHAHSLSREGLQEIADKLNSRRCVNERDALIAERDELVAYAKCEEARSRGEDIAETVLRQYGWTPEKGTSHEFMDAMRRAALAKVTK